MSSMLEALTSLEQEKTKRLFFLPHWTLIRWNRAGNLEGGLDGEVKHNVIELLSLTTYYRSVGMEEDGGLAFYPITKKESQCTVTGRDKDGMLTKRCPNKAEWKHSQRKKHEMYCDKCKNVITGIFPKSGKWEKIEGG